MYCAPARQQGFTLLEILVVITLVGIMAGAAMLSVGGQQARQLKNEAQRLQLLLNQARDESELTQRTLGVKVEQHGYQFLEWQADKRVWISIDTRPYQSHQMAQSTHLEAQTESSDSAFSALQVQRPQVNDKRSAAGRHELKPQIIFSASGDHSVFSLTLSSEEQQYQLSSDGYAATQLQACSGASGRFSSHAANRFSTTSSC